MAKQIVAKRPAYAWVSGGSSSRPRKGKPLIKKPASNLKQQQSYKRGAARLTMRRSVIKKPAALPYVPEHQQLEKGKKFQVRDSAAAGEVKLETLLGMTEKQLITSMEKGGQLHKHTVCCHCHKGKLTPLMRQPGRQQWVRRCRLKGCQKTTYPHSGHPIFTTSWGNVYVPLKTQACILFCAAWNVNQSLIPALIEDLSHKKVDQVYKAWRVLLKDYIKETQKDISYGSTEAGVLDEIEVDEAAFRKLDGPDGEVEWNEIVGSKRRGDRKSLYLEKRSEDHSRSLRAEDGRAAPPPLTKNEWRKFRDARVGEGSLTHSDGAPAYNETGAGSYHDKVCHDSRRGGKRVQEYTRKVEHDLPDGTSYKAMAGTQSIDGWWGHGKRACHGVKAQDKHILESHIRAEQWRHWVGAGDRWAEAGKVISWVPSK